VREPVAHVRGVGSGERTAGNPDERRVQPLQTLGTFSGDVHRVSPRLIGATRTAPLTVSGLNPRAFVYVADRKRRARRDRRR
jgi:hypothetical protein